MESHHFPPSSSSFKSSPFPAINVPPSPQLELYTIPTQSCWFSWDSIHETERSELREFFDNSSFTRSVKIYKEYRDFMISKYREDPSRRLTFTEVRKSLVGDVCVLRKVFNFLDKWGLINFSAPPPPPPPEVVENDGGVRVRVEEGAPFGVRVVVAPGSLKPVVPPVVSVRGAAGGDDGGFKAVSSLPLASYKDVFREVGVGKEKERVEEVRCGSCKEKCDSKYYECTKEKYLICLKCFEKGEFGENKVKEDFKINDSIESSRNQEPVWTEAETLLLLESVLKNGDDWEVVAQNVQTKTKHECISRLIELPLGELILGSRDKLASRASIDEGDAGRDKNASHSAGPTTIPDPNTPNVASQMQESSLGVGQEHKATEEQKILIDAGPEQKSSIDATQEQKAPSESRDNILMKDNSHPEIMDNHQMQIVHSHQQEITEMQNGAVNELQNGDDTEHLEPPLKKSRIDNSDPSRSLMEQVALLSTMVGPQITAAAANAAVTVLSDGNPLVRDIFYVDDNGSVNGEKSGNLNLEMERAFISEDAEMKDASHSSVKEIFSVRESIPLALQTRAAVGTALGAAAAHARLLADHEEKKIEHLVAFIIETQLKKVECKLKLSEDLEQLMQKQHTVLEESKDSILAQRLDILQRIVGEGISRLRDSSSLRPTSHDI
ncbi:SWI/SNF complex subunit SWI3A isoform X2 [Silene latifolia]|uniref:SWI/SNF complex subunit SWI3A isoform X2 n=1 Tax=Silene latifolia TaxID=37657 RepID=UPI003D782D81